VNTAHLDCFIIRDRGLITRSQEFNAHLLLDEGYVGEPGEATACQTRSWLRKRRFRARPAVLGGVVPKREAERDEKRVSEDAVRDVEFMNPSAAKSHLLRSLPELIA
jgi:hypothetical protein